MPDWNSLSTPLAAYGPYLESALSIALILALAWLLLILGRRAIRTFKRFAVTRAEDPEDQRRVETLARVFRHLFSILIVAVTGMLTLSELGISIAPILGAAGVVGIAVGFGAQSMVKDFFNGFMLLLENQVRVGDVVAVAGKSGLVEEVTLRHVRLRDYDGHVHFVPSGSIDTVTNMTLEYSYALMDLGVAYREDLDEVFSVIRATAAELRQDPVHGPNILEPLELAGVENWADSAVTIRCRFKCVPLAQWNVRREFLRRLKAAFDAHGIEIPYPHLTIYAGQGKDGRAPPLPLAMEGRPGLLQNLLRKHA
jgi:small conductance mechanosensitive channel